MIIFRRNFSVLFLFRLGRRYLRAAPPTQQVFYLFLNFWYFHGHDVEQMLPVDTPLSCLTVVQTDLRPVQPAQTSQVKVTCLISQTPAPPPTVPAEGAPPTCSRRRRSRSRWRLRRPQERPTSSAEGDWWWALLECSGGLWVRRGRQVGGEDVVVEVFGEGLWGVGRYLAESPPHMGGTMRPAMAETQHRLSQTSGHSSCPHVHGHFQNLDFFHLWSEKYFCPHENTNKWWATVTLKKGQPIRGLEQQPDLSKGERRRVDVNMWTKGQNV